MLKMVDHPAFDHPFEDEAFKFRDILKAAVTIGAVGKHFQIGGRDRFTALGTEFAGTQKISVLILIFLHIFNTSLVNYRLWRYFIVSLRYTI